MPGKKTPVGQRELRSSKTTPKNILNNQSAPKEASGNDSDYTDDTSGNEADEKSPVVKKKKSPKKPDIDVSIGVTGRPTYQKSKQSVSKPEAFVKTGLTESLITVGTFKPLHNHTQSLLNPVGIGILLISLVVAGFRGFPFNDETSSRALSIDSIKQKFPNQADILWRAVDSGINDTINYNRPTSYIFLYDERAENTTSNLLKELSEYAVCKLTECKKSPLRFSEVFESNETDYGSIITRYKEDLHNSGVMIIENLDKVPEKFALAFHSFCDDVSPLVPKSAFFFSMKVDKLGESTKENLRYVEEILRKKWSGVEDDQLGPLLTRITNMLIPVNPEKSEILTIDSVKEKFPNQTNLLWKAVDSGINDTINNKEPTSYIFLHNIEAENTTSKLLKELSEYAVCKLTECEKTPLRFSEVFESNETDYGAIITRYKEDLNNSGVMIIENLDKVPEKFALAFHSFCDQVSPLVPKSAFFFSMKVDKFGESAVKDLRYVENTLREKWNGIKYDQLEPLLTRITNMLIRVNPEKDLF